LYGRSRGGADVVHHRPLRGDLAATAAATCVILVFAAGLPLADALLPPSDQRVAAGTSVDLEPATHLLAGPASAPADARATFVPTAGWQAEDAEASRPGEV